MNSEFRTIARLYQKQNWRCVELRASSLEDIDTLILWFLNTQYSTYVLKKTYCTLAEQKNCSTYKRTKKKRLEEQNFSNQKNIRDSITTPATAINNSVLIDTGIFETQKTEKKDERNIKEPQPARILAQKKFDGYLIEAIDEALTSLGTPVRNTVFFQLENNFNIPKNEIPCQIEKFSDIMHKVFGLGASRLEIKFMRNLHSKIKVNVELCEYDWPLSKWIINDISFKEYVCNARKNYCEPPEKC
jgi:hypothetical protein